MVSTRASPPVSVFLDSSVLVAAALSSTGGARELLIQGLVEGRFQLSLSPLVLDETARNLARIDAETLPYYHILQQILTYGQVYPSADLVRQVTEVIEPKDAPIVAGAIAAHARFLATLDRKHLLKHSNLIRERFDLIVATPGDILKAHPYSG